MSREHERELNSALTRLGRTVRERGCFREDSDCNGNIIRAHSVQNNRVLRLLGDDGMVMCVGRSTDSGIFPIVPVGRRVAGTFPGFCKYHDQMLFRPIELRDYVAGDQEQEFLFGYRALAMEYWTKRSAISMMEALLAKVNSRDRAELGELFATDFSHRPLPSAEPAEFWLLGARDSMVLAEKLRQSFNDTLTSGDYSTLETVTLVFPQEYRIAVSSCFFLEVDLKGNRVNDLAGDVNRLKPLFLTVLPQGGRTFVLLSYLRKDRAVYGFLRGQVPTRSLAQQKVIVSNLICTYTENFMMSPKHWASLPPPMQERFRRRYTDTALVKFGRLIELPDLNLFC